MCAYVPYVLQPSSSASSSSPNLSSLPLFSFPLHLFSSYSLSFLFLFPPISSLCLQDSAHLPWKLGLHGSHGVSISRPVTPEAILYATPYNPPQVSRLYVRFFFFFFLLARAQNRLDENNSSRFVLAREHGRARAPEELRETRREPSRVWVDLVMSIVGDGSQGVNRRSASSAYEQRAQTPGIYICIYIRVHVKDAGTTVARSSFLAPLYPVTRPMMVSDQTQQTAPGPTLEDHWHHAQILFSLCTAIHCAIYSAGGYYIRFASLTRTTDP